MSAQCLPRRAPRAAHQRGQAMLLTVLLLGVGVSAVIYNFVTPARQSIERDRITAAALAQAKEALIGYAVGVDLTVAGPRPGDLPCPDLDNDGSPSTAGVDLTCAGTVVGRLPWKTLGLPDLRDGYGERLWYAVSSNFKNSPRTACATPGAAGCLNSDTVGTLTVRNPDGTITHNAATANGVVAVIIAPGGLLRRNDGTQQDRGAAGQNLAVNYLDIANVGSSEDNANFLESNTNGFINGPVFDANRNPIVNDRLITITAQELIPLLERRVAGETLKCLTSYAAMPQNNGRYPWAAPESDLTEPYTETVGTTFGRIPDGPMNQTLLGVIPIAGLLAPLLQTACGLVPLLCMSSSWPVSASGCNFGTGTWWRNWKEQVFFAASALHSPSINYIEVVPNLVYVINPLGVPGAGTCPACLQVNPPSASFDKQVVVMVAGKRLSTQVRPSAAASGYLELQNADATANQYTKQPSAANFNDVVVYK
jgi:hypothetical protein